MTRRTARESVRLEEILNNNKNGIKCPYLVIRRKSQIGGIKHTCQVITLESRSAVAEGPAPQAGEQDWSAQAPTPADLTEIQEWSVQPSPPIPNATHEHSLSLWRTSGKQCARTFMGLVERDQQRQWLQVQLWDTAESWHRYGIVASRTGHQQNHT